MTPERIAELRRETRSRHANFADALNEALDALEASQAQCAAMRKALLPFSKWSERLTGPNSIGAGCPLSVDPTRLSKPDEPVVANLHAAALALTSDAGAKLLADHAAELQGWWAKTQEAVKNFADVVTRKDAEYAALRAALEKYGQHTHKCERLTRSCCLNHEFPCTCGLDKILGDLLLVESPSVDKK